MQGRPRVEIISGLDAQQIDAARVVLQELQRDEGPVGEFSVSPSQGRVRVECSSAVGRDIRQDIAAEVVRQQQQ